MQEEEFESGGDKEYEGQEDQKENPFANRKTMKGEARDTLEERKRQLIQNDEWKKEKLEERKRKLIQNAQLRRDKGTLRPQDANKLRNMLGKLEKTKNKLETLLGKADEETIREEIPEASRARCLDAWSKTNTICLRIKQAISQKTKQNSEEYYSAAKKSLRITRAKVKLLEAIVHALRAA